MLTETASKSSFANNNTASTLNQTVSNDESTENEPEVVFDDEHATSTVDENANHENELNKDHGELIIGSQTSEEKEEDAPEQISLTDSEEDEEDDSEFDIIDGIMILTFKTKNELNEFTLKDEKLRTRSGEPKKRTISRKSTISRTTSTSNSAVKRKVTSTVVSSNQDSAFACPELDDYLSSKRDRSKLVKDNLDEYMPSENLYDNRSILNSYDSDSSFGSSTIQQRKSLSSSNRASTSSKPNKGRPLKRPEIILINETMNNLPDTNEMDSAYLRCVEQVCSTYNTNVKEAKNRFRPEYLHQQFVCRTVLTALHPNVIQNNSNNSKLPETMSTAHSAAAACEDDLNNSDLASTSNLSSRTSTVTNVYKTSKEQLNNYSNDNRIKSPPTATVTASIKQHLDLNSVHINSSRIAVSSKDVLFKIDPEEDNCLPNLVKNEPIEIDKIAHKKKGRNEYHEEGFDIARIISKHNSKRDIRLPARYHESIVGTEWILPNFEENKNRIVNTGSGKKQLPKDKRSASKSALKTGVNSLINSAVNVNCETLKSSDVSESLDNSTIYNPDDLMTEDEDNGLLNNVSSIDNATTSFNVSTNSSKSTISNLVNNKSNNNKKLTKEKEQKLQMLKELYRKLYYSNRLGRMEYFAKKSIKPRVNKLEVLEEGIQTIADLEKQQKSYASANNVLISWNNKLKLCLRDIEQLNGNLNAEKIKGYENMLNLYRTKGLNKLNQFVTTGTNSFLTFKLAKFINCFLSFSSQI